MEGPERTIIEGAHTCPCDDCQRIYEAYFARHPEKNPNRGPVHEFVVKVHIDDEWTDDEPFATEEEHPKSAFVNEFAVALLEARSHRHNGGATYIKYDDAVRIAHEIDTRRKEARDGTTG